MQKKDNLDDLLKIFAKGSFVVFIGVIISKIVTYLYKAIIARSFGQETYGLFSLGVLIFGFFSAIFSLGLPSGLLRYISFYRGKNEPDKIKSILRFSLILLFFVSLLGTGLLFFFAKDISVSLFHNSELTIFIQWFAIFIPVSIFAGLFHTIILAYEKMKPFSFIGNILSPSVQLIFLIIFILLGLKMESIPWSYNLGLLTILISSFFVCKRSIKEIFGKSGIGKKEKSELNKKLFSYSWPIMFLGLVMSLFSGIDSFAIGYFKDMSNVGIYNAALPLTYFLLIVPALFLQLFFPVITREYSKKNFNLIKSLSKQIGKWIFILNLPILIILMLFPGAVINLLFGSGYIQAENSLRLLSIGIFIYSIFLISENLLSMAGKSKTVLFNLLVASIVNIILNIILIPSYGINGAAFSTMLSYILWSLLSFFMAKYHTSVVPLKWEMLKILLVASIPTIALFYVRKFIAINTPNMLISGTLFVVFYFILIFLTHSLDKNDLMILRAIKRKIVGN